MNYVPYIDQKVENRSALIESLLQQWQQQQEDAAFFGSLCLGR
jgi:antitoxin ParD1/3/4